MSRTDPQTQTDTDTDPVPPSAAAVATPTRRRRPPPVPDDALRARVLDVHRTLCAEHGCPLRYFSTRDPLGELMSALLSHRTLNVSSARAWHALRERFGHWAAVRDAPVDEVERTIAGVTWPERKAPQLQAVLGEVTRRLEGSPGASLGEDALDFLGAMPVAEARAWLESISGVGPKSSAAVLSFSRLRRPALPVDSHHHRVAQRLGWLPPGMAAGPAHAWLESLLPVDWDAQAVYDHHQVVMRHGKTICRPEVPACERCSLVDRCPTGRTRRAVAD